MEIDPLRCWFKSFENSLRAQSLYKLSIRPDSTAPNSWYKIVLKEYEANNNEIIFDVLQSRRVNRTGRAADSRHENIDVLRGEPPTAVRPATGTAGTRGATEQVSRAVTGYHKIRK